MQHVKIYLMVIDVIVHRMIHVIERKLKIQLVRYQQLIIPINVNMEHVIIKENVLVFRDGQEIFVQQILTNVN
jgi:hypothetical protein